MAIQVGISTGNMKKAMSSFEYGDVVQKKKGYKFPGVVVAVYYTLKGEIRYVVECTAKGAEGCQHIFNGEQLELYNINAPES